MTYGGFFSWQCRWARWFFLPLFRSREKITGLRLPSGNLTVCYWKWQFSIVDLLIENGGSFHSYVNVYQRVEPPLNLSEARTRRPIWSSEDVEVSSRLQARENAPIRRAPRRRYPALGLWNMWNVGRFNKPTWFSLDFNDYIIECRHKPTRNGKGWWDRSIAIVAQRLAHWLTQCKRALGCSWFLHFVEDNLNASTEIAEDILGWLTLETVFEAVQLRLADGVNPVKQPHIARHSKTNQKATNKAWPGDLLSYEGLAKA